jgi:hypothetical protein
MSAVIAGARVGQHLADHPGQYHEPAVETDKTSAQRTLRHDLYDRRQSAYVRLSLSDTELILQEVERLSIPQFADDVRIREKAR